MQRERVTPGWHPAAAGCTHCTCQGMGRHPCSLLAQLWGRLCCHPCLGSICQPPATRDVHPSTTGKCLSMLFPGLPTQSPNRRQNKLCTASPALAADSSFRRNRELFRLPGTCRRRVSRPRSWRPWSPGLRTACLAGCSACLTAGELPGPSSWRLSCASRCARVWGGGLQGGLQGIQSAP